MTRSSPPSPRGRREIAFYPLAAAAFPVLSLYAANLAYVPSTQALGPLAVAVLASAAVSLVLSLVLRSMARGASAATAFVACFFGYHWLVSHLSSRLPLWPDAEWGAVTLLAMGLSAWKAPAVRWMNVLGVCLLGVTLSDLGLASLRAGALPHEGSFTAPGGVPAAADRPDVFYIVLDGHGRADALRRTMGYDDRAFIEGLRARGFYVADRSRSNYAMTEMSIPSSMNMDYVSDLLPHLDLDSSDLSPSDRLLDESAVERRFRAHGYRFISVTTGFPPVRFPSADDHLGNGADIMVVEGAILGMTPLGEGELLPGLLEEYRRRLLSGAFDDLSALARPSAEPRFVVAHILAPHPPFVLGASGEPVSSGKPFSLSDSDDFLDRVGSAADYRKGYSGQVAAVDRLTLQTIDRLLRAAAPGRRPVIVVQGDHGSRMHGSLISPERTDVTECFQNLAAFLVPDRVRGGLWPDITPVDEFRVILDGLFGEGLPILEERCLYGNKAHPFRLTDVTRYVQRDVPTSGTGAPLSFAPLPP